MSVCLSCVVSACQQIFKSVVTVDSRQGKTRCGPSRIITDLLVHKPQAIQYPAQAPCTKNSVCSMMTPRHDDQESCILVLPRDVFEVAVHSDRS